jgi:hypothetical protein
MEKFKDEIALRLREAERDGTDIGTGGNKEEEGPSADA